MEYLYGVEYQTRNWIKSLLYKSIVLEFYLVTVNHTLQNSRHVLELDLEGVKN